MTQDDLLAQKTPDTTPDLTELPQKPATLPDKFWDGSTGAVRLDALIKSYLELERHLARAAMENHESTEPDRDTLLKKLGRPDTPEGYQVCCDHGYFKPDPDLNLRLHQLGFTPDQAQAVYDLAVEKLVPLILDMTAEMQAEREMTHLHDTFGGPEKWARVARQLLAFGQKNLPPEILSKLASSYEGIMMLYAFMSAKTGDGGLAMGLGRAVEDTGLERIQKLMQDPKYWRDHDPKLMAKVQEGFARAYGE